MGSWRRFLLGRRLFFLVLRADKRSIAVALEEKSPSALSVPYFFCVGSHDIEPEFSPRRLHYRSVWD